MAKSAAKQEKEQSSGKEEAVELHGIVTESLPNLQFRVTLCSLDGTPLLKDGIEQTAIGYLSGKMKTNNIKVLPGDTVSLEFSPYDFSKARITYRHKK